MGVLIVTEARLRPVCRLSVHLHLLGEDLKLTACHSVQFPGAVNSKFTSQMSFVTPDENSAIPTYRVVDSDGVVVDKSKTSLDVTNEELLTWYKNMVSGAWSFLGRITELAAGC